MKESNCPFVFFLGGNDAEMRRIKEILAENGQTAVDKSLGWGAKASAYEAELTRIQFEDFKPVLVELMVDCPLPKGTVVIDHHGDRSGEAPALIQVLDLLGIKPQRKDYLISAMDAGYIYGLRSIGATPEETADLVGIHWNCTTFTKVAEGLITLAKNSINTKVPDGGEAECWHVTEAVRAAVEASMIGEMAVVHCRHSKTALITAHLFGKQNFQNILILSDDGEVNYYGNGQTIRDLVEHFPGGWSGGSGLYPATEECKKFWTTFGGSVPQNAFYGRKGNGEEILRFLTDRFADVS